VIKVKETTYVMREFFSFIGSLFCITENCLGNMHKNLQELVLIESGRAGEYFVMFYDCDLKRP